MSALLCAVSLLLNVPVDATILVPFRRFHPKYLDLGLPVGPNRSRIVEFSENASKISFKKVLIELVNPLRIKLWTRFNRLAEII